MTDRQPRYDQRNAPFARLAISKAKPLRSRDVSNGGTRSNVVRRNASGFGSSSRRRLPGRPVDANMLEIQRSARTRKFHSTHKIRSLSTALSDSPDNDSTERRRRRHCHYRLVGQLLGSIT